MRNELGLFSKHGKGGSYVYVSPIKMTPEMREKVERKSHELGICRSDFVRLCIAEYLAKGR